MSFEEIQIKIQNAKALDFGTIFNNVFEMYKKVWLKGSLIMLLLVISAIGISLIFMFLGLSPEPYSFNDGFSFDKITKFYSLNAIYNIPQVITISTLTIAFVGAFYRICKQHDLEEKGNDDYFYFFKKEYFGKILMLGIIYAAIATVAQLLFLIPYIYVFIPLSYFSVVFANNPDLSEIEITKACFSLGNKKWFITFGTMFIAGIIGMLGALACGIGILFTMSIMYLPVFFIYKEVVGFENGNDTNQIRVEKDSIL